MILLKKFADLYKSSAVVSIWTLISRVLGFARDILFAVFLGSGPMADAFLIAFRLPSLFRRFFAEGTFSAAFIPLLSEKNENDGLKEGLVFTSKITSILLLVVMPLIILAEIFMPNVVLLIAPGFLEDLYRFELAVPYARIVFPYLIFIIITSFSKNKNPPKYPRYGKSEELVMYFTIRQRRPAIMEQPTPKHKKVSFSQQSQGKFSGNIIFARIPPETQCTH